MATRIEWKHLVVNITSKLDRYSDGNMYTVDMTGFSSTSERTAINHAIAYLGKAWTKFLRLKNSKTFREIKLKAPEKIEEAALIEIKEEKVRVKRTRTKIAKLKKKVRTPRKRTIFTVQDDDVRKEELATLALLEAIERMKGGRK